MKTDHKMKAWIAVPVAAFLGLGALSWTPSGPPYPDAIFTSTILGTRTNASAIFPSVTNLYFSGHQKERMAGVVLEMANGAYIPAQLWLGDQFSAKQDVFGQLGTITDSGYRDGKPWVIVSHGPNRANATYDGKDPFQSEAIEWYEKAAELGSWDGCKKLGLLFRADAIHRGLKPYDLEFQSALEYLKLAAKRPDRETLWALGSLYSMAGDTTNANSCWQVGGLYYSLARMYLNQSNNVAAYSWWCVGNALEKDNFESPPFTSSFADFTFTPQDRAVGMAYAKKFVEQHRNLNEPKTGDHPSR